MITLTKPRIISKDNKPEFAVIPWDEYEYLVKNFKAPDASDVWFPNEVVKANVRGDSLIKAWREHLGLTQDDLALKAGMKQSSLARLERTGSKPRRATLKKLADAMGIATEQLIE